MGSEKEDQIVEELKSESGEEESMRSSFIADDGPEEFEDAGSSKFEPRPNQALN